MKHLSAIVVTLFVVTLIASRSAASVSVQDWPAWRGPTRDGQAAAGQTAPVKWSERENVRWRAKVRGKGHSSPTVVGNHVYLSTADAASEEQLVVCFDRATGRLVWETVVHHGNLDTAGHRQTSQASSSVVSDGERLYVNFLNERAVHTTALDPTGKIVWQRRVTDFVTHQGFGSSPVLHGSVVLVAADHKGGGKLAGLDKLTGRVVWQQERPKIPNYASPAVVTIGGRTQMIVAGCNLVSSFEPLTGKKIWEIEGSTEETVVTPVTDGSRVFVSGGFPKNHIAAVEADGSGRIAWQSGIRQYVPSMLVRDGHLFAVLDTGQAVCWKSDTGDEVWRDKVDRDFFASPVMLGNMIYATNVRGVTSAFEATPQHFKMIAQNPLGDESLSSPAICGNRIYLRAAKKESTRQEYLWCIGQ